MLGFTTVARAGRDLLSCRDRAAFLAWQDFVSPYRRTALSGFWAVARPVLPVSAYVLLRVVLPAGEVETHPVVYVAIGTIVWFLLTDLFLSPIGAFRRKKALLGTTQFPVIGIVATGAGGALLDFALRAGFALPFVVAYGQPSLPGSLLALALLTLMGLTALGLGTVMLPAFLVFPDLYEATQVTLRYLIFFSLAVFSFGARADALLASVNPIAAAVEAVRRATLGAPVSPGAIALLALLALASTYAALWITGRLGVQMREAAA